jgi:hypothetical protein
MPAPIVESSTREGEEPVKLPPNPGINRMSDKFKEMLAKGEEPPKKAAEKPPEALPEKAAEKPSEKPNPPTAKQVAANGDKEPKIPREHFKVLETQRDEFKTKAEQAEERAKLAEAKAKEFEAKIPTDYEQLKGKLAEADEIRKKFFVEQDPLFKQAFDNKIAAGIEEAKEAVGVANADRIAELLTMPASARRDAEIDEITTGMSSFREHALVQAVRDVRRLQKERANELAKPSENYKHLEDARSQQATKEKLARLEALDRAVKLKTAEVSKETIHFQRVAENEEHNQRVAENEKMLREFTTSDMGPEERANISAWAVRGIRAAQTDVLKDALIQKLQAELKAVSDSNPTAQGGGKPADKGKPLTAAEKYRKAMAEGIPEE